MMNEPQTSNPTITRTIEETGKTLIECVSALENLRDRLTGSTPQPNKTMDKVQPPQTVLDQCGHVNNLAHACRHLIGCVGESIG